MASNDPKEQTEEQELGLPLEEACSVSTPTLVVELEEDTHMTDTQTEEPQQEKEGTQQEKEEGKHVCFNAVEILESPAPTTSKTFEHVREYVRQIDSLSEMQQCFGEYRPTAKKRQQDQISCGQDDEETSLKEMTQKRMRGDTIESADIIIEEPKAEMMAVVVEDDIGAEEQKPELGSVLRREEEDNQEIAERFKLIMEMFDNFTKNLESLDVPTVQGTPTPLRRKRTNSCDVKDISPRIHRSRYDNYMQDMTTKAESSEADIVTNTATEQPHVQPHVQPYVQPYVQPHIWQLDILRDRPVIPFIQVAPHHIEIHQLRPAQKDIATAMSGFELKMHTKTSATIGCQTVPPMADHSSNVSMPSSRTELQHFTSLERVETMQNYLPMDCRVETYILGTTVIDNTTNITNATTTTNTFTLDGRKDGVANQAAVDGTGTAAAASHTVIKIPEPRTLIERSPFPTTTADGSVEHTFHTINIEATSSPSSSVMQRPPLCSRLWNVITDFCTAICLCLQVNRDSLFCLGFCIAFVVSASFLTAFFYRTLSVSPEMYRQQQMMATGVDPKSAPSGSENNIYL